MNNSSDTRWRGTVAALVVVLTPARARAADSTAAAAQFDEALRDYDAGKYAASAEGFSKAYELASQSATLYNLGLARAAAGQNAAAVAALRHYLDEGGASIPLPKRRGVARQIDVLLAKTGRLAFDIEPKSATVKLDTQTLPSSVEPSVLDVGTHQIEVGAGGYETYSLQLEITPGVTVQRVIVRLQPLSRPPQAAIQIEGPTDGVGVRLNQRTPGQPPLSCPSQMTPGPGAAVFAKQSCGDQVRAVPVADQSNEAASSDAGKVLALQTTRTSSATAFRPTPVKHRSLGVWSAVAFGTGSALGLTAAVLYKINQGRYHDWQRENVALTKDWQRANAPTDELNRRSAQSQQEADSIDRTDKITEVLTVAATGFLAVGSGLMIFDHFSARSTVGAGAVLAWKGVW